jgi:protein O-mannosyl-transferase
VLVLDDIPVIRHNPSIRGLWPPWAAFVPPPGLGVTGRPLLNFSFALSHALSGTDPWGYHLLNLAIHVLAGLALLRVLRRTLRRLGRPDWAGLALSAALLWVLHPLQTSTVTYISERSEAMAALFILLALYGFIRWTEPEPAAPGDARWAWLAVLACLLGVLSKEVAATAPVLVLVYDRSLVAGTFSGALRRHWRLYAGLATSWVVLGLVETGLGERGVGTASGMGWSAYALSECGVILRYLGLAGWPAPLVLDYGPGLAGGGIPALLAVAALGAAALAALLLRPAAGFAACAFFILLAPTSSIVPIPLQPMSENRMYLPLAAVLTLVLAGLSRLAGGRRGTAAMVCVAAMACAAGTFARNADYGDLVGLWRDTVSKRPGNARARTNLGLALLEAGRAAEAATELERAVADSPLLPDAHYNLGVALDRLSRRPDAIAQYQEAVRLKPSSAAAWGNLAIDLAQAGRPEEALPAFAEAARLDPTSAEVRGNLGMALLQAGRPAEASAAFAEAVRLRPESTDLRNRLAIALAEGGRPADAIAELEETLRLDPRDEQTHLNLGNVLANSGRMEEAAREFAEALRLSPSSAEARSRLDAALRALGRE